jgi:hypothetical protein
LGTAVGILVTILVRFVSILGLSAVEQLFVPETHVQVEQTLASPDGRHVAYVLIRDSGATTAPTRHVAISATGEPTPDLGNVFRARGPGAVSVQWEAERKVLVTSDAQVRFFNAMADGVWVTLHLRADSPTVSEKEQTEGRSSNKSVDH